MRISSPSAVRLVTFSSRRNTQSQSLPGPLPSFRLHCPPTFRQYFSTTSSGVILRYSAMRRSSSRLTHTYPGAPPQQLPLCEHVNFSPSAYQGDFLPSFDGRTSSFI